MPGEQQCFADLPAATFGLGGKLIASLRSANSATRILLEPMGPAGDSSLMPVRWRLPVAVLATMLHLR